MTFRNPVTSLRADQITPGVLPEGVLLEPGAVLPGELGPDVYARRVTAGAVDGLVITGATIRTAAAGRRLQIDNADRDRLKFYSGDPSELVPGLIAVGVEDLEGGRRRGQIILCPPALRLPTGDPVQVVIGGDVTDGSQGTVAVVAPAGLWLNGYRVPQGGRGAVVGATSGGATFGSTGGTLGVTSSVSYTAPADGGVDMIVTASAAGMHVSGGAIDYALRQNGATVRIARVAGASISAAVSHSVRLAPGSSVTFQLVASASAAATVTGDGRFTYLTLTATPA